MSDKSHFDFRIHHLIEAPRVLPRLAQWYVAEWGPWYGPEGEGDAEGDLASCANRDSLPLCLVAVDAAGGPLGTVSLKTESVGSELGVGPWLAAFLVAEQHRGRGVGRSLVAAIEEEAHRLGFDSIYTSVDAAVGARLTERGWIVVGGAESLRGGVTVYGRRLVED